MQLFYACLRALSVSFISSYLGPNVLDGDDALVACETREVCECCVAGSSLSTNKNVDNYVDPSAGVYQ